MRVVFNGVPEKRKGGCGVCGRSKRDSQFVNIRSYILPSGITKTFRAGIPEEVLEKDAEFLLEFKYTSNGEVKNVFEVA